MDKTTKNKITECFADLRKWDYKVYNLNSHKKMIKGLIGFSDYMITGKGYIIYVEVKIKRDHYSKEQLEFRNEIIQAAMKNPFVFYCLITENNYSEFYTDILMRNVIKLKNHYC